MVLGLRQRGCWSGGGRNDGGGVSKSNTQGKSPSGEKSSLASLRTRKRVDWQTDSWDDLVLAGATVAGMAMYASGGSWVPAKHLTFISEMLSEVAVGNLRRLMVFLPPRHGKSELISKYFPAWYIGNFPDKKVILASYEADFAGSWGRKARTVLTSICRPVFEWDFAEGRGDRWVTPFGGELNTAGVGGPITGKGADVLIIDDPVKNYEEALSETYREKAWDWYRSTARTRLEPGGAIILIMTRWHQDDLAGRLLKAQEEGGEEWTLFSLPALARREDPLGREAGAALWPDRFDVEALDESRRSLGSFWYSALYDQTPSPPEGNIFKGEWFRRYVKLPEDIPLRRIHSWDTAHKAKEENHYSVCTTMALYRHGYYIEKIWRGKVEYPELKRIAKALYAREKPDLVVVEDTSAGQSLIQELQRETVIPVFPWSVDRDKIARAHACTPEVEAGKVYLPDGETWVQQWIDELTTFPNAVNDDQVDSFTQAMNFLKNCGALLQSADEYLVDTGHRTFGHGLPSPMGDF